MATKAKPEVAKPKTYAEEFDEKLPGWMYQVPGAALILGGFGGLALITLF